MKIHYISCHAILEYDEVSLFTELGHQVFSNGVYMYPEGHPLLPRPGIKNGAFFPELIDLARRVPKTELPKELIEPFDVIIIMDGHHVPDILRLNWTSMRHKKVVLRMIGQSLPGKEKALQEYVDEGLKVVRYSPMEANLKNYARSEAIIRFYKDPEEFHNWNGNDLKVVNTSQTLKGRRDFCGYDFMMKVGPGFPFKVYGSGNEDLGEFNGGEIPYELLKGQLRDARVFLYGGTWPASYTLGFIEAWMTGIPVVSINKDLWKHKDNSDIDLFEIPKLIATGDNGFVARDVVHAKEIIERLLGQDDYARKIGEAGRQEAIRVFGKEKIKGEWNALLNKLQ